MKITDAAPVESVAAAVVVCAPAVAPSVRTVLATPDAFVTELVGFTEPPPATVQFTVMPATGFPFTSVTRASWGVASVLPTGPVRLSPENLASTELVPAVPVALNVIGLPVSPVALAVNPFAPAVAPRRHDVSAAIPLAAVEIGAVGAITPPPAVTAQVTATPATALPLASRAMTEGGVATVAPATAVWPPPACSASCVAGPAVIVIVPEVTLVIPVEAKVSVRGPTVPVIRNPLKIAAPVALVTTVAVPPSVPPPLEMLAVTVTPESATGFPAPSCNCTTGCAAKTALLAAVEDGAVLIAICAAVPDAIAIVADVSVGMLSASKASVYTLLGPLIANVANVATPAALVLDVAPATVAPPGPLATVAVTFVPAVVTALPNASSITTTGCCASATPLAPEVAGVVRNRIAAAGAGVTDSVVALVLPASPVTDATKVRPAATRSTRTPGNEATPATAFTVVVPSSVAPAPFGASESVIAPVNAVAMLPSPSRAVTCTVGASATPAATLAGTAPTVTLCATPGTTSKGAVVTVSAPALATSVYPVPLRLIERSVKVATPCTAVIVVVPLSAPAPGFVPRATVTAPV